jgi:hypothetical protein
MLNDSEPFPYFHSLYGIELAKKHLPQKAKMFINFCLQQKTGFIFLLRKEVVIDFYVKFDAFYHD